MNSWASIKVAEATTKVGSGATPKGGQESYQMAGVPLIRSMNVRFEGFDREGLAFLSEEQAHALDGVVVAPDDILLNITGASIGRVTLAPADMAGARVNQHVCIIRPRPGLEPKFVGYFLRAPLMQQMIMSEQYGATRQALTKAMILDFDVPLPPLNEQRRIVAKLEALLARSRRAKEALDVIPALLARFRQSVLAAAFRGDLTRDWREANPDVEPASALLERIRSERYSRWEEAELKRMRTSGKMLRDDRWKDRYEEPVPLDAPALPELPTGWSWAPLDLLLTALRNGIAAKPDREAGLPILRISAVRPLSVDLTDLRYLPESDEHFPYLLKEGDLLFTRYNGNADLVGSCAVVRGLQCPIVYPDKLIRGRVVEGFVLPELVSMAASCGASRAFIDERSKSAAGQVGISGGDLRRVPIPVPPLAEQRVLVGRVTKAFAKAASIDGNRPANDVP
ncbi:hypothetical protein D7V77_29865 [Corallococcus sp. CA041A]|uniref:restriction endonuclease subunit S n=1 Tax=Corallococcus sp. CA041A TaxID=2316727 RepID=UPI000EA3E9E1|nr:restriction endonuclease subunit S [Corallococcus sp. CA041A]RKH21213.1 hypothetical protein D7V77_29865 [Corallococcus sp. CA041A]